MHIVMQCVYVHIALKETNVYLITLIIYVPTSIFPNKDMSICLVVPMIGLIAQSMK